MTGVSAVYLLDAAASVGVSYSCARRIVHAEDKEGITAIVNRGRGRQVSRRALLNERQNANSTRRIGQESDMNSVEF